MLDWLQNDLLPNSDKFLGAVTDGVMDATGVLVDFFIGLIVSIYLMAGKENFCAQAKKLIFCGSAGKKSGKRVVCVKRNAWCFCKIYQRKNASPE